MSLLTKIEKNHLHLYRTKQLPRVLRGLNRELAEMYSHRDSAVRIAASVLHAANLQQASAFVLSKATIGELVASDPNITTPTPIRDHYRRALGMLKAFGRLETPSKAKASVLFFAPEAIKLLKIKSTAATAKCQSYLASTTMVNTATPTPESRAAAIWDAHGPDEQAWDQALDTLDDVEYEQTREHLKGLARTYLQSL